MIFTTWEVTLLILQANPLYVINSQICYFTPEFWLPSQSQKGDGGGSAHRSLYQFTASGGTFQWGKKKPNKIFDLFLMILIPLTINIVQKSKNQDLLSHIVKHQDILVKKENNNKRLTILRISYWSSINFKLSIFSVKQHMRNFSKY